MVEWAARARAGSFDLLGYEGLSFGDPIDWQLDPVSGGARRSCTGAGWIRSTAGQVGDSKVLGAEPPPVAGDARAGVPADRRRALRARRSSRSVRDVGGREPRGRGINWASSLEVALRLISWCWALALFGDRALPPGFEAELLAMARRATPRTSSATSRATSRPTRTSPARRSGSSTPGCCCRQPPRRARWRERGVGILAEQLERQVLRRRRLLRAVHLLPALHGRDLPALPDPGARSGSAFPDARSRSACSGMLDFLSGRAHPTGRCR